MQNKDIKIDKSVIYCRVSSDKQVQEGHGLEGQEQRCRKFAKANNVDVLKVFKEKGVSGAVQDRPAMNKLLEFLKEKTAKQKSNRIAVIIFDIDRLARHVQVHRNLKAKIKVCGGKIVGPRYNYDDSPEDKFIETIMSGKAEMEREINTRRVNNGMRSRLEKGYWAYKSPEGYKYEKDPNHGKVLVRDEPIATAIEEALKGYASGRFSDKTEVKDFLAKHQDYPRDKMRNQRITRIMKRVIYAGYIKNDTKNISLRKGFHKGIITFDQHKKIMEKLGETNSFKRKDKNEKFPLRGFVLCDSCKNKMTGSTSKGRGGKYSYYRCYNKECDRYGKSISKGDLEGDFKALLNDTEPSDAIIELAKMEIKKAWKERMNNMDHRKNEMERKLKAKEDKINKFFDRITSTTKDILIEKYETKIEELEEEKELLKSRKENINNFNYNFGTASDTVLNYIKNPLIKWEKGGLEEKQLLYNLVFSEEIAYNPNSGFGTIDFSLPYKVIRGFENQDSHLVD